MMPLPPVRLTIVGFAMLLAATLIPAHGAEPAKPNVLLLMVDDLNSWLLGDINRYAGKVVAPNLQRLAKAIGYVGNVPLLSFDGPPKEVLEKLGVEQTVR